MTAITIGLVSVTLILLLIIVGMPIPVAFIFVSFLGLWVMRGDLTPVANMLAISASDAISEYVFGVIPLFVFMGLLVMQAGLGRDSYAVANQAFRKVPGGLGMSTVGGNAIFGAITGVSVASATVFTKLAVPEMLRYGYHPRFAVGVVAGSSILGMLIPPSLLFILFGILTETSIGSLFLAGVLPGIILSMAYCALILGWARWRPAHVGRGREVASELMSFKELMNRILPITALIALVLGGLYGGYVTATEAGAVGCAGALAIALLKRTLTLRNFWTLMLQTGAITTALLILIISANLYSRMLALTGLPMQMGEWFQTLGLGVYSMLAIFVGILLVLGCIMDSASILFLTIPLVLPVFKALGVDLVWLGVITIITVEIGLLTPPFGMAAFVVKQTLDDKSITLTDIFIGAAPFALTMLAVVGLVIAFPWIATGLAR
ncbi:MAG: TRAP transporter large permease [Bosea sp. (in: a-proteobacteria)]